tara:strand:- start:942 stop:1232 length:291 start_codon:yes stop_codon:yes gene_type:complete
LYTVKSNIIKQLSNNYPNFLKKDLIKFIEIVLFEIKNTLKRGERVEIRDSFVFQSKTREARIARNPKTNEKINVPKKKLISFKMSKEWAKKINEQK